MSIEEKKKEIERLIKEHNIVGGVRTTSFCRITPGEEDNESAYDFVISGIKQAMKAMNGVFPVVESAPVTMKKGEAK